MDSSEPTMTLTLSNITLSEMAVHVPISR